MKKMANGAGSVIFLGNNRSRPYAIRVTTGYTDEGKQKFAYVDYYKTKEDALYHLLKMNRMDISFDTVNITFAQAFNLWWRDNNMDYSPHGTQNVKKSAYKNCSSLWDIKMRKIKKKEIQKAIDDCAAGQQTRKAVKTLCCQIFDYCIDNDIVSKNYATNCDVGADDGEKRPHKFISGNIAKNVMACADNDIRDVFTILLYTGARINEILAIKSSDVHLDDRYMIGGNKTAAGKKRNIPIADRIEPIIRGRLADGRKKLFVENGKAMNRDRLNYLLSKCTDIGDEIIFHDARHTFVTNMRTLGVDKVIVQRIVGHKGDDVTDETYTHITPKEMLDAVNKLDSIYK